MPPAGEALAGQTVIDISHESLMRVWQRLNTWADEEAQSAQTYRRLADTAALHAAGKAGPWRDPDLQLALNWRDQSQPNETWASLYHSGFAAALHFLTQSSEARAAERAERENQRRRELAQERAERERQERELEQARALAEARAEAESQRATQQEQLAREQAKHAQEQTETASELRWLAFGLLVAAGVGFFAWIIRGQAIEQARIAGLGRLVAEAKKLCQYSSRPSITVAFFL